MANRPRVFRPGGQIARAAAPPPEPPRLKTAERGYGGPWRKAALGHLRNSPLCVYCELGAFAPPTVTAATLVDHLYPHRGDTRLFWIRALWVSSCAPCHSGPKQAVERRGLTAVDRLARRIARPLLCEALAA